MTDDALAPHTDTADDTSPGPSRRAIVAGTGAIWAAPAITVLASAPAFAASGQVQVTAFLPDATRPVSAYRTGTTQTFTATLTQGGSPVAAGTSVVFTLDRLPGDTTSATDWLSLHPTTTATTATTTTDADGKATVAVRYLPGVVPTVPTTLRLTATTSTGSATLATWNLTYRPARPGTPDPHGAYALTTSSEASHTLIGRNGVGYAFGLGNNGRLGRGTTASSRTPTTIATTSSLAGRTITAIAASNGSSHCLALASDGTLHAWGNNSGGQLGDGTTTDRSVPVQVTTNGTSLAGKTVAAIATGVNHSLALASDGTLHAWGLNTYGQLGDGTTTQRTTAVAVTVAGTSLAGKTITAITAGTSHSLALAADGTAHAWGDNSRGQLGTGTNTQRTSAGAVTVAGSSLATKTITAIAAGDTHTLALASDGTVHGWGNNSNGQLGVNTAAQTSTAVATTVTGTSLATKTITTIAAGFTHSLALATDGTLHAWGANGGGQLGDGTTNIRAAAVAVAITGTSLAGKNIVSIAGGYAHSLALASDGTVHAWGSNSASQLGDGTTTQRSSAVAVLVAGTSLAGKRITAIAAGFAHGLALASDGAAHAWGANAAGRLGDGTLTNRATAVAVLTTGSSLAGKTVIALATGSSHSLALDSDGTVHAWGGNNFGQLGDGTTTDRLTAIAVATTGTSLAGKTIVAIAAGALHSLALASDGTLHAWGYNFLGQLGDGSTSDRTTAVRVATAGASLDGKTVTAIAAGNIHSLALATDGSLHAWGSNGAGRLGDGTTTNRSTPTLVNVSGTALESKTVTAIAAGTAHNLVLASDGTVHAWGDNGNGRLGDNTTTQRATPVPVTTDGTSLDGKAVTGIAAGATHSLALTSDGTVHAWGDNGNGRLGDNTTTRRTTAISVTTPGTSLDGRAVVAISAANAHSLALASDGTMHAWGINMDGQLGDGTSLQRTTAVLVRPLPA
ncbi:hypothetical protein K8Z61_10440 [Nocardioides sp. TRM66260-LWL]|uniref:RCC1-like domain-containing protein n=1 Tax=Nocardioides sp. TRM66260-LWL TaxID=2874478 RepID=UPI001CC5B3C4|nr:hypothetical protein [Nocardioides sp. TRM66260-LWL]MBZ5734914.1 hypothetical protein [Nocardioides sp. TRM66260-LWL]